MVIFKYIGIMFIALGILTSGMVFLAPFGIKLEETIFTFWLLYILCFIGGFLLYALSLPDSSARKVIRTSGVILLGCVR